MTLKLLTRAATAALLISWLAAAPTFAQKPGGILRMYHFDSPASLSLHEEVTFAALGPAMGLFNNLVMFDQHVPQSRVKFDRAGPGDRMVVGLIQNRTAFSAPRGGQVA
jgi:hypothetical protein